jgi:GNAT superfamily N-acetyltransferase
VDPFAPRDNLLDLQQALRNSPAAEVVEEDGLVRWRTGFPMVWFNGVLVSRPPREGEDPWQWIDRTIAYFRSQAVEEISWWLAKAPGLEGWREALLACGFQYDDRTPGMTANISGVQPSPLPTGLRIVQVETPAILDTWCKVASVGFGMAEATGSIWSHVVAPLGYDRPVRYYLGYLGGRPVATSGLFFHNGIAGVYKVTTLDEARKKGIGAAMTAHALFEARQAGYSTAVLQASPMGFPIYQRLGFRTTCTVDWYSRRI